jgi:pullulanase
MTSSRRLNDCHVIPGVTGDLIGPAFKAEEKGFATGKTGGKELFEECFKGMPFWCKNPTKCINYVSCHDGYTLFDRIGIACPEADFEEKIRRNNLAAAVYMLSQGVPFFQAGEEMLRQKINPDGTPEHNSYKSPDSVNSLKWSNLSEPEYKKVFEYYKGLIRFRKAHGALRLESAGEVYSHVSVAETGAEDVFAFHIWGGIKDETAEAIFVAFNPTKEEKNIHLPVGKWKLCINGENAGTEVLSEEEKTFVIPPLCAVAMIK